MPRICTSCHSPVPIPDDARFCPSCGAKADIPAAAAPVVASAAPRPVVAAPAPVVSSAPMPDAGMTVIDGPRAIAGRFIVTGEAIESPVGATMPAGDMQNGAAPVRLTLVSESALPSSALADRALREWKQLGKVTTPRVVRVIDQGKLDDGKVYVASAVPAGKTLEQIVAQDGQLSIERIKLIVAQVGEALTEAQKVGVIHRDVSPRNIHVDGDNVTVGEFGLAEAVTDKVFGTPAFLSPEQAEGKPVDQRSNIYSLGAIIYYMLVGRPPFEGTPQSLLTQHVSATPPHPSAARDSTPAELDRIVTKALEKSGGRRHLTLRQLITEVEAVPVAGVVGGKPAAATTVMGAAGVDDAATVLQPTLLPEVKANAATEETPVFAGASKVAGHPKVDHPDVPVFVTSSSPTAPTSAPTMMAEAPKVVTTAAPANAATMMAEAPQAAKAAAKPVQGKKPAGGFRETAWFKKGELEEEMAKAQAAVASQDPLAPTGKTGQHAAIDEGAIDVSTLDSRRLSLKTGATQMMQAIKVGSGAAPQIPGERMNESEMLAEIDQSRGRVRIFAVVIGLVIVIAIILIATHKSDPAPAKTSAVTPAAPAVPASPTPAATGAAPAATPTTATGAVALMPGAAAHPVVVPPPPADPLVEADAATAKADYPLAVDALLRASRASANAAHLTASATALRAALVQASSAAQAKKDSATQAQLQSLLAKVAPLLPPTHAAAAPKKGKHPAKLATRHR